METAEESMQTHTHTHTHTHTREFHSAVRNKETLPFVTPLDGPSGHYAK